MEDMSYDEMTEHIAKLADKLEPNELRFANELITCSRQGKSQGQAYKNAVSRDIKITSAYVTAARWAARPHVAEYVSAVKSHLARQSLMTLEEIQAEVTRRAMADMTEFIGMERSYDEEGNPTFIPVVKKATDELTPEQRRLIKSITLTKQGPKFEMGDQRGYMDMLLKMIGGYAPEKQEVTTTTPEGIKVEVVAANPKDDVDNEQADD